MKCCGHRVCNDCASDSCPSEAKTTYFFGLLLSTMLIDSGCVYKYVVVVAAMVVVAVANKVRDVAFRANERSLVHIQVI